MQAQPGEGAVEGTRPLVVVGFVVSLIAQLGMIVLGVLLIAADDDDATFLILLAVWCGIATLYEAVTLIVLGRLAKRPPPPPGHRPTRIEVSRVARVVSLTATILSSLIGLFAAFSVLGLHNDPTVGSLIDVVGVWAMLLSWGFLHWGFAQVYYQRYYAAEEPPFRFPNTEHPRIVDFVYFSYTVGTSFAASDVEVLSTRVRWTIVWHSVISFFFNGLIIVLALNTITGAAG
ncbi:hypothetical protein ASE16_05145 [Leifsonia sp. Root227]|uniref:DUF1345 domain-containing protein n=1 Tax=unclassified Leifsonia TaxID=2663824 RepID=UPI0006FB15C6|nr:DUF1345 domain-containing protein [Leifsonia sp. Root227]KRC50423.1 hypothetical protein ASE16_05145 [Leifsonia sp. Root227]